MKCSQRDLYGVNRQQSNTNKINRQPSKLLILNVNFQRNPPDKLVPVLSVLGPSSSHPGRVTPHCCNRELRWRNKYLSFGSIQFNPLLLPTSSAHNSSQGLPTSYPLLSLREGGKMKYPGNEVAIETL